MSAAKEIVLVTGASGYIAAHLIKLLQEEGYRVRGTVRSIKNENRIKHLYNLCPNAKYKLELVEADLLQPDSWTECPKLSLNVSDVRDVALAHSRAMTVPEAAGNRHIVVTKDLWIVEIAAILDKEFRSQGYNVPTKQLPDGIFAVVTWFNKLLKTMRDFSGKPKLLDTSRMTNVLGITPIDVNKTFVDMGYSLIENGIVQKTSQYRGPPRS